MDPLDDLLRGVRAEGALLGTPVLTPPYALRFVDGAALTLVAPLRGEGWIVAGDTPAQRVGPGDTAIVLGPEPFLFSDAPDRLAAPVDVRCDGSLEAKPTEDGTTLLAGAYNVRLTLPQRLLAELPPALVVTADHDCSSLRDYLEQRIAAGALGRHQTLDRLLDWLMICTLRDWFELNPPAWYQALGDNLLGPVLRAMHRSPEAPWTLPALANLAGISRTTLSRRFTDLTGESPLAYLTDLRMTLAAELLSDTDATVASVARRVGYADAFSFSAAFKRERGTSPSSYTAAAGA
ncbi:AraC family transcriptional regulator [Kribbella sancticallisti]|uniref:AraC family transcriptional regulator n=1 Tax=Kribbella sancticallisti TaxID=460087 RepID=A0ABN2DCM3_9ACTN